MRYTCIYRPTRVLVLAYSYSRLGVWATLSTFTHDHGSGRPTASDCSSETGAVMAARKSTTQHRSKEGVLEYKKSEGVRKVWKPYSFKVSASTYLLYFKSTDLSKPEGQLLLANVTQVLPSASKGASFPFEVIFRGKGSPWKLNASSNDERISWMEAILPGSSKTLTNFKQAMAAHSPPPMQGYPYNSPPSYSTENTVTTPTRNSPVVGRSQHAHPNAYTLTPHTCPLGNEEEDEYDDDFLSASLPPSGIPQNYVLPMPSLSRGTQSLRGAPGTGGPEKFHAPPKRVSSAGNVVDAKPKPSPRRSSAQNPSPIIPHRTPPQTPPRIRPPVENGHGGAGTTADDDPYIAMTSSPVRRPAKSPAATSSGDELELPDYLEVVASQRGPALDEDNYVLTGPVESPDLSVTTEQDPTGSYHKSLSDDARNTAGSYHQGAERGKQLEGAGDLADTLSRHFNHEQIGMLIHMLQEVRVDRRQSEEDVTPASPSSPIVYSEQDSVTLRGNLQRALSYAPPLTERILVTEDDSEESYEIRPQWAKAVRNETVSPQCGEQLDTLSDLQHQALYLAKSDLEDFHEIGQGQFGKVFKASMRRGSELTPVAIKMTKNTNSDCLQDSFLKEMRIMSQMMHPNIVRLYGLVTEDVGSPWIVLEYMENGDLKTFLTKNERPIQQLVKYMVDVAMGMHYISERGLVHRDLAARNVLVGSTEICKVADFGLLREIPRDDSIYHSQHNVPCPIRWMPPESISDRHFSPASDVWSFGVLVWEMFNPTKLPYAKYDNIGCATKVNEGLRMPIPRGTPSVVAKIMKACWHKNPKKRPSFLLISTLLSTRTTF